MVDIRNVMRQRSSAAVGRDTGGGSTVRVEGLDELRRGLRHMAAEARKDWTAFNRKLASDAADWARSEADGLGGPWRHFSPSLFGSAAYRTASVGMRAAGAGMRWWGANATFWGSHRPQHPPWVGSDWDVAPGQGPYAIVPAILRHDREIMNRYGDLVEEFAAQAFPDGADRLSEV